MYRLRFVLVILQSLLTKKKLLSDDFKLKFWAIPLFDTDFTLLFTQTYGQYMGLARWNLLFNSEFRTAALKKGWVPVTTRETISYKRPVKAFDRVTLTTRILHWNERRFYLEHIFHVKNEIRAIAYVEGLVRSPRTCKTSRSICFNGNNKRFCNITKKHARLDRFSLRTT